MAERVAGGEGAAAGKAAEEPTLGRILSAARETRGVSVADALERTRIPAHYLRMLESGNYSSISDEIYLLPFLRRYAEFLALDIDDVTMRFVREVQRAETNPIRTSELRPLASSGARAKSNSWVRGLKVAAMVLLGAMGFAVFRYFYHPPRPVTVPVTSIPHSPPPATLAPPAAAPPDVAAPSAPFADPAPAAKAADSGQE